LPSTHRVALPDWYSWSGAPASQAPPARERRVASGPSPFRSGIAPSSSAGRRRLSNWEARLIQDHRQPIRQGRGNQLVAQTRVMERIRGIGGLRRPIKRPAEIKEIESLLFCHRGSRRDEAWIQL